MERYSERASPVFLHLVKRPPWSQRWCVCVCVCVCLDWQREQRELAYISLFHMRTSYYSSQVLTNFSQFVKSYISLDLFPPQPRAARSGRKGPGSPSQIHTCQEWRGPAGGPESKDASGTMRAKSHRVTCQRGVRHRRSERLRETIQ